jgi:uncharacterized membrane protein (UPF0136 family)
MTPQLVGQIALGTYAILVAIGGIIGFITARSRPSLIAGLASGAAAAACLVVSFSHLRLGFGLGAVLAAVLLSFFGTRFARRRKFMPGGLMVLVSLAVLVLLVVLIARPPA